MGLTMASQRRHCQSSSNWTIAQDQAPRPSRWLASQLQKIPAASPARVLAIKGAPTLPVPQFAHLYDNERQSPHCYGREVQAGPPGSGRLDREWGYSAPLTYATLTAVGVICVLASHVVDLKVLAHPHLECPDGQLLLFAYTQQRGSATA